MQANYFYFCLMKSEITEKENVQSKSNSVSISYVVTTTLKLNILYKVSSEIRVQKVFVKC